MTPFFNYVYKHIKNAIEYSLIDIPDLSDSQKKQIARDVANYAKVLIVEITSESIKKTLEDKFDEI